MFIYESTVDIANSCIHDRYCCCCACLYCRLVGASNVFFSYIFSFPHGITRCSLGDRRHRPPVSPSHLGQVAYGAVRTFRGDYRNGSRCVRRRAWPVSVLTIFCVQHRWYLDLSHGSMPCRGQASFAEHGFCVRHKCAFYFFLLPNFVIVADAVSQTICPRHCVPGGTADDACFMLHTEYFVPHLCDRYPFRFTFLDMLLRDVNSSIACRTSTSCICRHLHARVICSCAL